MHCWGVALPVQTTASLPAKTYTLPECSTCDLPSRPTGLMRARSKAIQPRTQRDQQAPGRDLGDNDLHPAAAKVDDVTHVSPDEQLLPTVRNLRVRPHRRPARHQPTPAPRDPPLSSRKHRQHARSRQRTRHRVGLLVIRSHAKGGLPDVTADARANNLERAGPRAAFTGSARPVASAHAQGGRSWHASASWKPP